MEPDEYIFWIDAFTPDTLPMGRLAEYMATLAKLMGHPQSTHFVRLEEGSAKVVHKVDVTDAPKVADRVREAVAGLGSREATKAFRNLDDLLANDNAIGELRGPGGAVVIAFAGRTRAKPLVFPIVSQIGSLEGQIVQVGGRDSTAHAVVQNGGITYTGIVLSRAVARELAPLLYGPKIRLIGNGKWERLSDGTWRLDEFKVDRFESLDERPIAELIEEIRNLKNNGLMSPAAYTELLELRADDGAVH